MSPHELTASRTSSGKLLIRIIVGWVFLSEGIQKFLFPDLLGVGRFVKIGSPWPQYSAPFVGAVEIIFSLLILLGLFTTLAVIPLLIDIVVAILSTKIPFLLKQGFWPAVHESRVDLCMLFGLLAIALLGAGSFSLDHKRRSAA